MKASIDPKQAKDWFGARAARPDGDRAFARRRQAARGADYLYTYLRTFYRDDTKAHRLEQPRVPERRHAARAVGAAGPARAEFDEVEGPARARQDEHRFNGFEQVTPGTLTPLQYDEAVGDLVAYLQWMGEPAQNTRVRVGVWVLIFLGMLHGLRLAPERRVLERREVDVVRRPRPPRAAACRPAVPAFVLSTHS